MSLETYISEFSKYIIALIALLYTVECFLALFLKKDERRRRVYVRQTILIFAFHFSGFLVIVFETGKVSYLIFYALQQITVYAVVRLYRHFYPDGSRLVINNMCMLISVGFVMLTRLSYAKAVRQYLIAGGGLLLSLLIPYLVHKLKLLKNLKWIYAAAGVLLLGIVLILGQTTYGSKLSYRIAGILFQPSEFVKIIFIFYLACALSKAEGFLDIFTAAVIAGLHVVIQVGNKDLGSALIFFVIFLSMLYVATGKFYWLLLGLAAGGGASYAAYRIYSHVQQRVIAWQDPFKFIDGVGYQITQSLFGISSGGLFGLGLFKGDPGAIPFVEDDFIFSALAEEMGIIFAICIILICLATFLSIMRIANAMRDRFYQLIAFGIGVAYIFQVFLTIGGGTKFVPLTGVTLPFVSYGGSSLLTTIIMFGIVEGMYLIRGDEVREALDKKARRKRMRAERKEALKEQRKEERIAEKKAEKEAEKEVERKEKQAERKEKQARKEEEKRIRREKEEQRPDLEKISRTEYDPVKTAPAAKKATASVSVARSEKPERNDRRGKTGRRKTYEDDGYAYDDGYGETYLEETDEDLEFIHGFTRKIEPEEIEKKLSESRQEDYPAIDTEDGFPFDEIGEIYYNEQEYEKDRAAEEKEKKKE